MQRYTVYFIWKLLYLFRVVSPPIIRSANNCIYNIWYLSDCYCYLPLYRQAAVTVWQIPDAADTVVCTPDDGWRYHPKHVEQSPDKINCVVLHIYIRILGARFVHYHEINTARYHKETISGRIKKTKLGAKADIPTYVNNVEALHISVFLVLRAFKENNTLTQSHFHFFNLLATEFYI
jgi:hypothetical protein